MVAIKKALTPAKWKKKIDAVVSKLVRLDWRDTCAMCGKAGSQTHHYFTKGAHGGTRFTIEACVWLCYGCHIFRVHRGGETEELRDKLIAKIGDKKFEELKRLAYEVKQFRTSELAEIYDELSRRLIYELENLRPKGD